MLDDQVWNYELILQVEGDIQEGNKKLMKSKLI